MGDKNPKKMKKKKKEATQFSFAQDIQQELKVEPEMVKKPKKQK